ncbi:MAG TPA: shikimate dehydrogenase [Bacteroidales bacterium]|jgi:shikimate dehydrogenase|nr:shikimate dehydrogenase [Bacteroidales bacterium]
MRKFGLIGYPLGHSFSRKYFQEKFERENLSDCTYDNYPVTSLGQLPDLLHYYGIEGLNVTIPYKTAVIRFLDEIDPEARAVGAVNVLKIKNTVTGKRVIGFNSDITGIRDTLEPVIGKKKISALVLGTGGSSKAVCHVLESAGIKYMLVSRSAKEGCLTYPELSADILEGWKLIINTTPLGMYPDIETKPDIPYDLLGRQHILFDLVYNPEITAFLQMGTDRGCTTLSGLKMLYSQAEKSWEIWNNDSL